MKITYLPQQPVRYGYNTPSMSRRGGTRLDPMRDGVINPLSSQETLRTRDFAGNKLRDVTNPVTGMYSHSTSLIESSPLNPAGCATMKPGVSGSDNAATRLLPKKAVDTSQHGRIYLDEDGRVIRTTAMGEAPVIARPRGAVTDTDTKPLKKVRAVSAGTRKPRARSSATSMPIMPITDEIVEAYVRATALKRGIELTVITREQMMAGREALKVARKQAEAVFAKSRQP